jgi:hypothetical protein
MKATDGSSTFRGFFAASKVASAQTHPKKIDGNRSTHQALAALVQALDGEPPSASIMRRVTTNRRRRIGKARHRDFARRAVDVELSAMAHGLPAARAAHLPPSVVSHSGLSASGRPSGRLVLNLRFLDLQDQLLTSGNLQPSSINAEPI